MIQTLLKACLLALVSITLVSAANSGSYTITGLGKRKQQILNNGGGIWDLAIAMLETNTLTTNYSYGDGKSGDSTNFGIFKQNWDAILNKKLAKDIKARQDSQTFYGADKWFAGHRNGESGLSNPYTQDITNYKNGVNWIHDQLASNTKYLFDDTRFWVDVVAI